ncbi:oxygenase MpaB family protein [Microcella sp.]|uniref:oxygenase MpaB family protein n=1 Tax=Microcella sp. TaxID=1913979 RepID=UPI003F6EE7F4
MQRPAIVTRARGRILVMFSGDPEGTPEWVRTLETGDDEGFFGPGSAVWEVHSGIPTVVAGIRALLMQTLHPGAMAGVHDHSRYREDPLGRLSGTVRWVLTTTFADRAQATAGCAWVSRLHEKVRGEYPSASGQMQPYAAADADLIGWVHCVFADAFIGSHETWGGPVPGGSDQYVREWATAGELMGMTDPPRSRAELDAAITSYLPVLRRDERVNEAVRWLKNPPLGRGVGPAYRILFAGAVASLPEQYRALLGLRRPRWPAIALTGLALRWMRLLLGSESSSLRYTRRRLERLAEAEQARTP